MATLIYGEQEPVTDAKLILVEFTHWMQREIPGMQRGREAYWIEKGAEYIYSTPAQFMGHTASRRKEVEDWDEVIRTLLGRDINWVEVAPKLQRGEYHKRIWRNGVGSAFCPIASTPVMQESERPFARARSIALHRIQRQLLDVVEVVAPVKSNEHAYGAATQQLLSLAAREVETLLRAGYEANVRTSTNDSSITSWFGLSKEMRLAEWAVALAHYPEWGLIAPFSDWTPGAAPDWWTANNKLKHDDSQADRANLKAAINAVAAIHILLEAQFGPAIGALLTDAGQVNFQLERSPNWEASELYFAPRGREPLVAVPAFP